MRRNELVKIHTYVYPQYPAAKDMVKGLGSLQNTSNSITTVLAYARFDQLPKEIDFVQHHFSSVLTSDIIVPLSART